MEANKAQEAGPAPSAMAESGGSRVIVGITAFLLAAGTWAMLRALPVHHDIGWPLWVAEQVLSGSRLYEDVVEVHPPLIVVVAMVSVLMGRLPGLTPILAYHLVAMSAAAISLFACWRILGAVVGETRVRLYAQLGLALVVLPLAGYAFGLEEHFMLTLVLPYMLLVGAIAGGHEPGAGQRLLVGVLAGLGFSMKPLYGPVWIALVAYLVWVRGRRSIFRVEIVAPAAVMVAYIAGIVGFASAYFGVAELAAGLYFDFFPTPLRLVLLSGGTAAAILAVLVHFAVTTDTLLGQVRRVLLIGLIGFFVIVVVQQKGWSYHWFPVYGASLLLGLLGVLDRVGGGRFVAFTNGRWQNAALATMAVAVLACGGWRLGWCNRFWGDLADDPYHLPQMQNVVQQFGDGGSIVALSTTMQAAFPLVNHSDVRWGLRFSCLWMIPGLYAEYGPSSQPFPYRELERMSDAERYLMESVIEDLQRERPTLLIVDRVPPSPTLGGFNYLDYFGRDNRFAEWFQDYTLIGTLGRYLIFKRTAQAPLAALPAADVPSLSGVW